MNTDYSLGELIRKMRLSAGKSQIDLATEIGSHQPFISNFEKNRMKPDREQIIAIGFSLGLEDEDLNLLLDLAGYERYNHERDKFHHVTKIQSVKLKAETSKEFNTQLEDLKYLVTSLEAKLEEGKPDDDLKNQIEELQTTVEDIQKKGATLSAPVQLPSTQKMAVKLIPTNTFNTLEEYRSDQNKWFSICTLFIGSILGIFINLSTGGSADKTTWIVLSILLIVSIFSGHSGWSYHQRSKKLKETINDMYTGDNN